MMLYAFGIIRLKIRNGHFWDSLELRCPTTQRDAFFRIVPVCLRGRIPLSPFFNDMIDREVAVQEWRQTLR